MKININISVDLTQSEIQFLRKYFEDPNQIRRVTLVVLGQTIRSPYFSFSKEAELKDVYESLIKKEILKIDNLRNISLTTIGKLIVEKIDRGNIIDDLLN